MRVVSFASHFFTLYHKWILKNTHKNKAREYKESIGLYDIKEDDEHRLIEMAWQDRVPFEIIQKK